MSDKKKIPFQFRKGIFIVECSVDVRAVFGRCTVVNSGKEILKMKHAALYNTHSKERQHLREVQGILKGDLEYDCRRDTGTN